MRICGESHFRMSGMDHESKIGLGLFNIYSIYFFVRWKTFNTKHDDSSWSSSIGDHGYGPLTAPDYKDLMESQGFRVALAKPIPLYYRLTKVKRNKKPLKLKIASQHSDPGFFDEYAADVCLWRIVH